MARGSILKRTNKNGTVTFSIKYRTGDGTQVKKAIGQSKGEAQRALTAAVAAVDRGDHQSTSREIFEEAAARWLEAKRPRIEPATYRDYEIHLRLRLVPEFGRLRLRQITRQRIEAYLAALDAEGRLSRSTINASLIPLSQVLGRATRDGVLASNPVESADRDDPLKLPYEQPTMLHLNREEVVRYLGACRAWYLPLAETLIGSGMRIGEAIALEWRDISWDSSAISVSRAAKNGGVGGTKGDRGRQILVAPYLLDLLKEHRSTQATATGLSKLVFLSPEGCMLNRDNVRHRGHQPAVRAAGLSPALRLHDLRHTAATLWLASGQSIYFVKEQLGHRDIQTTIDRYGHPDVEAHRAAAAKAAEWWREVVS